MTKRYSLCTFKDKHDVTQSFMKEDEDGNYVKVADYEKATRWRNWPEEKPDIDTEVIIKLPKRRLLASRSEYGWRNITSEQVKAGFHWLPMPELEER